MKPVRPQCPNCGGEKLYRSEPMPTIGPVNFLHGLGEFLRFAEFVTVICADCGLIRFFADAEAINKLPKSDRWRRL